MKRPPFINTLIDNYIARYEFISGKFSAFGLLSCLCFFLVYYLYTEVYPQPYENLAARIFMTAISIGVLFHNYSSSTRYQRFMMGYMYFIYLAFSWFSMFMSLMNPESYVWAASSMFFIMILVLFLDKLNLILVYLSGTALAFLSLYIVEGTWWPGGNIDALLLVQSFSLFVNYMLSYDSDQLLAQKKRGALESLSFFAHETRTPLTAIRGYAQELYDESQGREKEKLHRILQSSDRLDAIVQELFSYWQLENTASILTSDPIAVDDMLSYIESILAIRAKAKSIDYDVAIEQNQVPYFLGDFNKLSQIITNLAGNAVKFTDDGGVYIRVATYHDDAQPRLEVSVRDTGAGIRQEQITRILEPYQKAESGQTIYNDGIGLGLNIVKQFLLLMDTELEIDSEPGVGSTFRFSIDITPCQRPASPEKLNKEQFFAANILYCDDNQDNLLILSNLLAKHCVTLDTCDNGEDALKRIATGAYDLVLLDLQMPDQDGYLVASKIRHLNESLPVIALSAYDYESIRERLQKERFSGFLSKPFTRESLQHLLHQHMPEYAMDIETPDMNYARTEYGLTPRLTYIVFTGFIRLLDENRALLDGFGPDKQQAEVRQLAHELIPFFAKLGMHRCADYARILQSEAEAGRVSRLQVKKLAIQLNKTYQACVVYIEWLPDSEKVASSH